MFNELQEDDGEVNLLLVSTLMLGLSTILFCALSISSYLSNQKAQNTLDAAKKVAFQQGQADQQKVDKKDYEIAQELPFRSYKAPDLYGNFEVKFPKNWNAYVTEDQNATTQVDLLLNPEAVKVVSGIQNNYALRSLLVRQDQTTIMKTFQDKLKAKKITQKDITVSGITGVWLDGQFDEKHNGVIVLIPVRDKTLELITDTHDYLTEFNQILSQSTIVK